jgi:hypothetical protein
MAERTIVESMSGTIIAISASLPATYDAAGYGATTITYTAIEEVESISPHGLTKVILEFTPVGTGVKTKLPGVKDYGNITVTAGFLPSGAGQDIVRTAAESTAHHSLKITYPDTSVVYLDVITTKDENQNGDIGAVHKAVFEFAICRAPVVVAQV